MRFLGRGEEKYSFWFLRFYVSREIIFFGVFRKSMRVLRLGYGGSGFLVVMLVGLWNLGVCCFFLVFVVDFDFIRYMCLWRGRGWKSWSIGADDLCLNFLVRDFVF